MFMRVRVSDCCVVLWLDYGQVDNSCWQVGKAIVPRRSGRVENDNRARERVVYCVAQERIAGAIAV